MSHFIRRTIAQPVQIEGKGLHSGVPVVLTVHPGTEGIAFRYGAERTLARPENVTDTRRSTKLGSISTIEHLMAAFAGLEITDAEVEVTAPEIPGVDGSALPFVTALQAAGLETLGEADLPDLYRRVFLQEDGGLTIAVGKGTGHGRFVYARDDRWPGEQAYESLDAVSQFATEIAPARTFALSEEVPHLAALGLGQGLDETSAVIVGTDGYANAVRFEDELARHKLLDLMGDLYLAGIPLRALNFVGQRSGHRTHVEAAAMVAESIRRQ